MGQPCGIYVELYPAAPMRRCCRGSTPGGSPARERVREKYRMLNHQLPAAPPSIHSLRPTRRQTFSNCYLRAESRTVTLPVPPAPGCPPCCFAFEAPADTLRRWRAHNRLFQSHTNRAAASQNLLPDIADESCTPRHQRVLQPPQITREVPGLCFSLLFRFLQRVDLDYLSFVSALFTKSIMSRVIQGSL